VPLLPNSNTFSRRSRNSERANSSTVLYSNDGWRGTRSVRLLTTGKRLDGAAFGGPPLAIQNSSSVMRSRSAI